MTAEVVPFPSRAAVSHAEINDTEDIYGPPPHSEAWVCNPCAEDPGVPEEMQNCFYVTRDGVRCWTCHAVQYFT